MNAFPINRIFLLASIFVLSAVLTTAAVFADTEGRAAMKADASAVVPAKAEDTKPLKKGDMAPDAKLRTSKGSEIKLSSLLKQHNAVVVFYRGGWCPYCNVHLGELNSIEDDLIDMNVRLIALSPDKPEKVKAAREKQKVGYELYSDSSMEAARAFGLAFQLDDATVKMYKEKYNIDVEGDSGEKHHQLPVPSAFVIGEDGKIAFAHSNPDYKVRIKPEELLAATRKLVRR